MSKRKRSRKCLGCDQKIVGSAYKDDGESGPFCGPCLGR